MALLMTDSADWGVCNWSDVVCDQEPDEFCLGILRVKLNLVNDWLDPCIRQKIPNKLCVEVGYANRFGVSFVNQCLQFRPELVQGFHWLSFDHKGPVNQVQIDVV